MIRRLLDSQCGATLAEFALVLPIYLLFVFGLIDGGRLMWEVNRLEKATQAGARAAIVTNILSSELAAVNYVGRTVGGQTLTQGDRIPVETWVLTCTSAGCTCTTATCPASGTYDATETAAFNFIVRRMQAMKTNIGAGQVAVDYRSSGLGFAGDPNGMDVAPLVTVRLRDDIADANRLKFRPITGFSFVTFNLPAVGTTLTAEDMLGTVSN